MQNTKIVDDEKATQPCNLCGNDNVSVLGRRSRNGAPLRTVICKNCGLVWCDPFPYDPRQFYQNDYRVEYKKTVAPKPKHVLRAGKVALNRFHKIKHLLTARKTILDVGTGGGEFAYLLQSLGHELLGVEPNRGYAEYSAAEYGLNLQIGFIQDAQFSPQSFDLITIWHVLEHTEDPGFVLNILYDLLKPQGILVVEVPNVEAVCQSPKSSFHEAHLFNFNFRTLAKLGEKMGFAVEEHLFSDDFGNITLFFRKGDVSAIPAVDLNITDNAEFIISLVKGHSSIKHYLRPTPYQRFLRRMYRAVSEKLQVRVFKNDKNLLDQLYYADILANKV
jgi:2-polyprenyl-3-methyl-5-hydroxy-6-metoxy-1,4-benzoquinol methylase